MKRSFVSLLFLVVAFGTTAAFARNHHTVKVTINKSVNAIGGMKLTFVELVEDSRCPEDVQCVWAGNAKIKVRVSKNGKSEVLELNTMQRGEAPTFSGYRFKLVDLRPRIRSNVRINRNAYEATIEINKAS